ncbi:glycosyltransferase [Ornithinimicrobium panacihumi]|uniref:glycosyltransferase family 4 protein n=1 Tax=Ornithinimicrobium panacihumi TaxID=2008449 RepID=UPI003F88C97C
MTAERYLVVGSTVEDPTVVALTELAARHGMDVRGLALRPPVDAVHVEWRTLPAALAATTPLAGLLQHVVRRVLRGEAAALADALVADDAFAAEVAGAEPLCLVAVDDAAAQALARWRGDRGAVGQSVLTWDQGADRLARALAEGPGRQSPPHAPGGPSDPPLPQTRPQLVASKHPGAMHRVAIAGRVEDIVGSTQELGRLLRAKVRQLAPGQPVPRDVDILVLAGLGPAVAGLSHLPLETRVVHLARPEDRSSPWRHLLGTVVASPAEPVVRPDLAGGGRGAELGAAILGPETAELVRLGRSGEVDEALRRVEELLDHGIGERPDRMTLLREMAYLTRLHGAVSLERRVLEAWAGDSRPEEDVRRLDDTLLETDPVWVPELPTSPYDPVPGRVVHLLKSTLPQRQAGYSVRGHHTLRALAEAGVDVVALAMPERADPTEGHVAGSVPTEDLVAGSVHEEVLDGVRYLVPPPVPATGTVEHLRAAATVLLDLVVAQRPEVLHVHSGHRGYDLGVVGAAIAGATATPWVYEVRGLFESLWTSDPDRAERAEVFRRRMTREADLVRRADATVTLAETMRADLLSRPLPDGAVLDPDQIHVVPNAVDPARLRPTGRDPLLARDWETEGRFTFGYISNLDHQREQVEDLIRAAVLMAAAGRHVKVLVVGTGTRAEQLQELTREIGAERLVTFTGKVPHDQVAAAYALLDVLVVPRGDERAARLVTPLKPYEAMAMGLPVIVSDQPALLEVIGDGERGWSYPAGDADALARLLGELADDPQGREQVAARGQDWVRRERTWAGNAERYQEIYRQVRTRSR